MQYFARKWLYFGEAHHAHPDGEGTILLEQDFDIARTKKSLLTFDDLLSGWTSVEVTRSVHSWLHQLHLCQGVPFQVYCRASSHPALFELCWHVWRFLLPSLLLLSVCAPR